MRTRRVEGSSDADVSTLCKKRRIFSEFMVCQHGQGEGIEPVRTFCGQGGRESNFRDFIRTCFMDGPLQYF